MTTPFFFGPTSMHSVTSPLARMATRAAMESLRETIAEMGGDRTYVNVNLDESDLADEYARRIQEQWRESDRRRQAEREAANTVYPGWKIDKGLEELQRLVKKQADLISEANRRADEAERRKADEAAKAKVAFEEAQKAINNDKPKAEHPLATMATEDVIAWLERGGFIVSPKKDPVYFTEADPEFPAPLTTAQFYQGEADRVIRAIDYKGAHRMEISHQVIEPESLIQPQGGMKYLEGTKLVDIYIKITSAYMIESPLLRSALEVKLAGRYKDALNVFWQTVDPSANLIIHAVNATYMEDRDLDHSEPHADPR